MVQLICAAALVSCPAFGAETNGVADLTGARAEAAETFKNRLSPPVFLPARTTELIRVAPMLMEMMPQPAVAEPEEEPGEEHVNERL